MQAMPTSEGVDLPLTVYHTGAAASNLTGLSPPIPPLPSLYINAGHGRPGALMAGSVPADGPGPGAGATSEGLPARERGRIGVFHHLFAGQAVARRSAAIRSHVQTWPRDALVLSLAANQGGLIGMSGLSGRGRTSPASSTVSPTHYGEDWWFQAHHGMALSEIGRHDEARPMIERSLAQFRRNAYGARAFAHLCYETAGARCRHRLPARLAAALRSRRRLVRPPRLASRPVRAARREPRRRSSPLQRGLLCGRPSRRHPPEALGFRGLPVALGTGRLSACNSARWSEAQGLCAGENSPAPASSLADWHVALTYAASRRRCRARGAGSGRSRTWRARCRYPSGSCHPHRGARLARPTSVVTMPRRST